MRKVLILCGLLAMVALSGCIAGSHIQFGPMGAKSSVAAHEWREADFYCEDGRLGSTFGFLSSEIAVSWDKCTETSIGAYCTWDKDKVRDYPSVDPIPPTTD